MNILKMMPALIIFDFAMSQQITKSIDTVYTSYQTNLNNTINIIRFTNTLGLTYLRMIEIDSSYIPNVDSVSIGIGVSSNGGTNYNRAWGWFPGILRDSLIRSVHTIPVQLNSGDYFELRDFRAGSYIPLPKASDIRVRDTVIIPLNLYFTSSSTAPISQNPLIVRFYVKGLFEPIPGKLGSVIYAKNNNSEIKKYNINGKVYNIKYTNSYYIKNNRHLTTRSKR